MSASAPEAAARALVSFENVRRRLELRGEVRGIRVYDDFAHHPTAIRTTLDGLRRRLDSARPSGAQPRILAVFEPRSNTMKLGAMRDQLPWSLEEADAVYCHSAGLGWDAAQALAPLAQPVFVSDRVEALVARVAAEARPGDHVVCMSNGGFGGLPAKLVEALAR